MSTVRAADGGVRLKATQQAAPEETMAAGQPEPLRFQKFGRPLGHLRSIRTVVEGLHSTPSLFLKFYRP